MSEFIEVPLSQIFADSNFNCRGHITPQSILELAVDIEEQGMLQPVVVGPKGEDGRRLLLVGYRRYASHEYLGRETIMCSIRDDIVDKVEQTFTNLR